MSKKEDALSGGLNMIVTERTASPVQNSTQEEPAGNVEASAEQGITIAEALEQLIGDEELVEKLKERRYKTAGRPRKSDKERVVNGEKYTRFTTIVSREQISKLKEIGLRECLTMKEIFEQIFGDAIEAYERTHGVIKTKTKKGDVSKLFK